MSRSLSDRFYRAFVGEGSAEALALVRIVACAIPLLYTIDVEDLPTSVLLPPSMLHPMGVMELLLKLPISFGELLKSPLGLEIFQWGTRGCLFLGMIGLGSRAVLPASALLWLVFGGILRQYTWFFHTGLIPLYLLTVLSWMPCADAYSADHLLRRRNPQASLARYGWSLYTCLTVIALPYFASGLSKVRNDGFSLWLNPLHLKAIFFKDSLNPMFFSWNFVSQINRAPDTLLSFMGLSVVLGELSYVLVLFSRRARLVLPVVAICLHLGIFVLQDILFPDLIVLQATLLFIFYRTPLRKPARSSARGKASVPIGTLVGFVACATLLLGSWIFRVEWYPFTSMRMYTNFRGMPEITYFKLESRLASGVLKVARPENAIPVLRFQTGYRQLLHNCFESCTSGPCRDFLESAGAALNRDAAPSEKIVALEAQKWQWNLVTDPSSPTFGKVVDRCVATF